MCLPGAHPVQTYWSSKNIQADKRTLGSAPSRPWCSVDYFPTSRPWNEISGPHDQNGHPAKAISLKHKMPNPKAKRDPFLCLLELHFSSCKHNSLQWSKIVWQSLRRYPIKASSLIIHIRHYRTSSNKPLEPREVLLCG